MTGTSCTVGQQPDSFRRIGKVGSVRLPVVFPYSARSLPKSPSHTRTQTEPHSPKPPERSLKPRSPNPTPNLRIQGCVLCSGFPDMTLPWGFGLGFARPLIPVSVLSGFGCQATKAPTPLKPQPPNAPHPPRSTAHPPPLNT